MAEGDEKTGANIGPSDEELRRKAEDAGDDKAAAYRDDFGRFQVGHPYRFQPGQSGNPKGRPPRGPLTDALERALEANPKLADWMVAKALKHWGDGKQAVLREVWERLE